MKNAIEKTDELLDQLMYCDFRTEVGIDKAKDLIRRTIKKQDRDTRHACAEAVLKCDEDVSGECIWKDEAHSACMNAQAV